MPEEKKEITVRDIIQSIQKIFKYLFSKWMIILIAGIIGGVIGLVYAFVAKPEYMATTSFILSDNSNSQSMLAGIASQVGINLSSSSEDAFSGDNIISLMGSGSMVEKALLLKPDKGNENLANLIARELKLDVAWQKQDRTKNAFPFPDSASQFKPVQDSLLREIYNYVEKYLLTIVKPDDQQSVYRVTTTSKNEIISYWLTKYLVNVTSDFYINTKTSVARQNVQMLNHEADSLRGLLGIAITNAASETDRTFNLNQAYQVQRSSSELSQANATVAGTAYGEIVKNLEIAKINLMQLTPLYQIIDDPKMPLIANKPHKLSSLIIGGFLGGFIIILYLLIRKVLSVYS